MEKKNHLPFLFQVRFISPLTSMSENLQGLFFDLENVQYLRYALNNLNDACKFGF